MGYTRPVSVLNIKAKARAKYAQMGRNKMLQMITPISKCLCTCTLYVKEKCYRIVWLLNLWLANVVAVIECTCTLIQCTSQGLIQREGGGALGFPTPSLSSQYM